MRFAGSVAFLRLGRAGDLGLVTAWLAVLVKRCTRSVLCWACGSALSVDPERDRSHCISDLVLSAIKEPAFLTDSIFLIDKFYLQIIYRK